MTVVAEIAPETSARICAHMNDDHAATIHAMVMSHLSHREVATCKIQNAKMTSVSIKGYLISYILCNGELCEMKNCTMSFDPPLTSAAEVRPRLIEDHHRALIPKFTWLITDPIMRTLFGACHIAWRGHSIGAGGTCRLGSMILRGLGSIVQLIFGILDSICQPCHRSMVFQSHCTHFGGYIYGLFVSNNPEDEAGNHYEMVCVECMHGFPDYE